MRMRKIVDNRTLKSAAAEFLAFKRAQKIRERTLHDYQKYINPFIEQSSNSMDIDVLKRELLEYFANIPATSPARYNHPKRFMIGLVMGGFFFTLWLNIPKIAGYMRSKSFDMQK